MTAVVLSFPHGRAAVPMAAWTSFMSRLVRPAAGVDSARLAESDRERDPDEDRDDLLIGRACRGDRDAFDKLYRRHVDAVWRRVTHLLGPDPEREDLTQQVFLEVFGSLPRFRAQASFRTYLCRVAVNIAYDHLKRRRRAPVGIADEVFETLRAPDQSPEGTAVARQRLQVTWSLLEKIKPKKRVAFLLRVVEGLSLEQIAMEVDAKVPAVAQRIKHAHDELQEMMRRREGESS